MEQEYDFLDLYQEEQKELANELQTLAVIMPIIILLLLGGGLMCIL